MTDVVLSPVPYYGGTLQMGYNMSHYCDMGNGKLLNVIVQTNPSYVFAYVTNVTNLKTGTLSSTNAQMRAIFSPGAGGARDDVTTVRVYKLNSTAVLLKMGYGTTTNGAVIYRIITILPNDDVALSTPTFPSAGIPNSLENQWRNSFYEYGTNYSTFSGNGSHQNFWNVGDNILFSATRTGSQAFVLNRLVYDPSAKSITVSTIQTFSGASYIYTRFNLLDIPNSTKKLFYVQTASSGSSFQASTIGYAAIIEPTSGLMSIGASVPSPFSNCTAMCALSESLVLGFVTNTRYYSMSPVNTSTWGTPTASTILTQAGGSYHVAHAEALDTNYFALFTHALSTNNTITTDQLYLRIGRYVDKDYGQVSSATNTSEGLLIGTSANPYVDEKFINRVSTDAFYIYGRGNTTSYAPLIKVLYQPGG